jgi:hypothetical protein
VLAATQHAPLSRVLRLARQLQGAVQPAGEKQQALQQQPTCACPDWIAKPQARAGRISGAGIISIHRHRRTQLSEAAAIRCILERGMRKRRK